MAMLTEVNGLFTERYALVWRFVLDDYVDNGSKFAFGISSKKSQVLANESFKRTVNLRCVNYSPRTFVYKVILRCGSGLRTIECIDVDKEADLFLNYDNEQRLVRSLAKQSPNMARLPFKIRSSGIKQDLFDIYKAYIDAIPHGSKNQLE